MGAPVSSMARPKHCYLPHRSHLGLEMATRACQGAGGVPGGAVWACFGAARALEMSVRDPPKQCYLPHQSHLGLKMATWTCLGAAGVSGRAVWGVFQRCPGAQNGRSKPPVQPLGPRNCLSGLPRCWWSARQADWACFGVARVLKMAAQSRQCA